MSDALHCPNCDAIVAAGKCISCGWTHGSGISRDPAANPYKHHRYAHHAVAELPTVIEEPIEEPGDEEEAAAEAPAKPAARARKSTRKK